MKFSVFMKCLIVLLPLLLTTSWTTHQPFAGPPVDSLEQSLTYYFYKVEYQRPDDSIPPRQAVAITRAGLRIAIDCKNLMQILLPDMGYSSKKFVQLNLKNCILLNNYLYSLNPQGSDSVHLVYIKLTLTPPEVWGVYTLSEVGETR